MDRDTLYAGIAGGGAVLPHGARLTLEPPQGRRAGIEFLTVGGPYPGLDIVEALPAGFDWRTSHEVTLIVDAPQAVGATPIGPAEITDASAAHHRGRLLFRRYRLAQPGIGSRAEPQIPAHHVHARPRLSGHRLQPLDSRRHPVALEHRILRNVDT